MFSPPVHLTFVKQDCNLHIMNPMRYSSFSLRLMLLVSFLLLCNSLSSQQLATGNQESDEILRFQKYTCMDQQGTGIEAFSFLMEKSNLKPGVKFMIKYPRNSATTHWVLTGTTIHLKRGRWSYQVVTIMHGATITENIF